MKKIIVTTLAALISLSVFAQLPKVIILATGGTIAGQGASADRSAYTSGQVSVHDLIAAVPGIDKIADLSAEQISNVGSQDMTEDIWLKLNKRINEIFAKHLADAVVVTHGTDTMEETAYFLNLTLRYDNPVVLTGSMRPSTAISADGPKNLYDAVTVAASPLSKGHGVVISFNESIFDGREAVKFNTTHVNAFVAPNAGPIGQVYDGKVIYYAKSITRSDKHTPFDLSGIDKLPRVALVELYCDAPSTALDAYTASGVDGIITAGLGNGNLNKANTDAVFRAVSKGIIVARASRVPTGRVTLYDETDDAKLGTIVCDDLNPQKARILLMLGLTQTHDKAALQKYFFTF